MNGPFTPDRGTPISQLKKEANENNWPLTIEWGLIGSCTNSSYEDISRAASIAAQAVEKGLTPKAEFGINPVRSKYVIQSNAMVLSERLRN